MALASTCERNSVGLGRNAYQHDSGLAGAFLSGDHPRDIYLHSVPADARNAVEKVEKFIEDAKSESEQGGQIIGPNRTQLLENAELASTLIQ